MFSVERPHDPFRLGEDPGMNRYGCRGAVIDTSGTDGMQASMLRFLANQTNGWREAAPDDRLVTVYTPEVTVEPEPGSPVTREEAAGALRAIAEKLFFKLEPLVYAKVVWWKPAGLWWVDMQDHCFVAQGCISLRVEGVDLKPLVSKSTEVERE
jgi:hypothetical protein